MKIKMTDVLNQIKEFSERFNARLEALFQMPEGFEMPDLSDLDAMMKEAGL